MYCWSILKTGGGGGVLMRENRLKKCVATALWDEEYFTGEIKWVRRYALLPEEDPDSQESELVAPLIMVGAANEKNTTNKHKKI